MIVLAAAKHRRNSVKTHTERRVNSAAFYVSQHNTLFYIKFMNIQMKNVIIYISTVLIEIIVQL